MTTLLEGARKLVTRGTELGTRIEALELAAQGARGRLDDGVVDEAAAAAHRAASRMRLSARHTVVGIAGATGSGKSSTYNALTGLELSAVGVRRPTTSWASACVWGHEDAEELLEWLGIPPRHRTARDSMLDERRDDRQLDGVVLLDLPDHDSTEVSHHLEVDRLVQLTDLLVWVLDPQKYADAAIHDRYLAPLQSHRDVMVVVLNHIDTVPEDQREAMVADVRRLLAADGLSAVPVYAVSARHGIGIEDLRGEIAGRVRDKASTRLRLEADLRAVAERMAEQSGEGQARSLSEQRVRELEGALADAAGVPTVVEAVERSTRVRGGQATGWPVVSWVARLRPDPLKRLHLDLGDAGRQLTGLSRTSLPATTPVQRARVDTEVRALADEAAAGLGRPWAASVRRASTSRLDDLGDRLDAAMASTDLQVDRLPWWTRAVRGLQWLLLVTGAAGLAWLLVLAVLGFLGLPEVATPSAGGLPAPTVMLLGGVLLGILLGLAGRVLVRATARSRARTADKRLRRAVAEVATELVVAPVSAELAAHAQVREALATIRRG
ncbi:GTPase HflX [Nocardioides aquaticus]|uniref:GTPase HflX n=2 Tax=Nocardioides aquaticus TaxID=160826 RepID=A0ABX8EP72_9ACTN|nr:GTPase [Nocardioides aquaticus]QVT81002.1 GTPase HflX [Nocardioides aquaticus]